MAKISKFKLKLWYTHSKSLVNSMYNKCKEIQKHTPHSKNDEY